MFPNWYKPEYPIAPNWRNSNAAVLWPWADDRPSLAEKMAREEFLRRIATHCLMYLVLMQPALLKDVCAALVHDASGSITRRAMRELMARGLIVRDARRRYYASDAGRRSVVEFLQAMRRPALVSGLAQHM